MAETESERIDRNWNELLQELRVTQTGTQILTGFLLTIPFQQRFVELDDSQRIIYLILVAFAALSWFIVAVMARQPQKVALPVAIAGPILFYLLFDLALDVQLPTGLWF